MWYKKSRLFVGVHYFLFKTKLFFFQSYLLTTNYQI
eukprot:UN13123